MRSLKFTSLLFSVLLYSCSNLSVENKLQYIDTRIGTAMSVTHTAGKFGKNTEEFGQTLPAVLEPNGMNFWTPQTRDTELKCIAPYYYQDSLLQGFRNSHWIVGGCTQDYGSMTLMTLTGELRCTPTARGSRFIHDSEIATPSYYSVELPDEKIIAEMTARSRSAIFRFTYEEDGDAWLVVNPNSDEGEGYISIDTHNKMIYGYNPVHRIYQGKGEAAGFSGHFVINYRKELLDFGAFCGDSIFPKQTHIENRNDIGLYLKFNVKKNEQILFKAASSFTDREGALANLHHEIPHWEFERTQNELTTIWEERLSSLQVETPSIESKQLFYGALYRSSFLPRAFNDVDGRYPSFSTGKPIHQLDHGETYYEDFSMWDTYRALHPLINILTPTKGGEMMQSLVSKYEQGGWLPIFPCWNSYTNAMIGDHVISAIADAYAKGIGNFDMEKAYEAMRKNAFETPHSMEDYKNGMGRRALDSYLKYGYIPSEDSVPDAFHDKEQVSRTLEYAYDDFALIQAASIFGTQEDYLSLIKRSQNYRNVIDPATGYAQGRYADGSFLKEDNAFSFTDFITEGAPCHYTWYVPHDVKGLANVMGGEEVFISKLDSMFSEGRYWHGNEPCHQIAYMYNYVGQPWKAQKHVNNILKTEYLNAPGGLSGNDDAGQMSAWYIFSALGFYPVCPGMPYYVIGSPTFERAEIRLENSKLFTMISHNVSPENIFIQSVLLDGEPYNKNYILHDDIMSGSTFEFTMGSSPNTSWGVAPDSRPPSMSN